ncbi:MAG: TolC family protein [Pseudomonadota bacterium]
MRLWSSLIAISLSLVLTPRAMQAEECLTLVQAVKKSAAIDPSVGAASARLTGAEARLLGVKSEWRPQVSGFAQTNDGPTGIGDGRTNNQLGITVSQRLWDFGRGRAEQASAAAQITKADHTLDGAKNDIATSTAQTYLSGLKAWERARAAELRKSYLAKIMRGLPKRLAARDITAAEKSRAEAEYAIAEAELIQEELALQAARSNFSVLTGGEDSMCMHLQHVDTYFEKVLPPTLLEIVDVAIARHPDILAMEAEQAALIANLHSANRNRAPIVTLQGVAALSNDSFSDQFEPDSRIGLSVNAPLYGFGKYTSEKQEAAASLRAAELSIDRIRRDLEQTVTLTWQRAVSYEAIARSQATARDRLRDEAAALAREFENGLRPYQDVLQAEASVQRAVMDEIEAKFMARQQTLILVSLMNALTNS